MNEELIDKLYVNTAKRRGELSEVPITVVRIRRRRNTRTQPRNRDRPHTNANDCSVLVRAA
jgi:hypothetical protein